MFQSSPGGSSAFGGWENSSFKLTDDMIFITAGPNILDAETQPGARCLPSCPGSAGAWTRGERDIALASPGFQHFRQLFADGFVALCAESEALVGLVELAGQANPHWRCWGGDWRHAATLFRERLELNIAITRRTRLNFCCKAGLFTCCFPSHDARAVADHLIDAAIGNFGANCYDRCQRYQNDIQYFH